MPLTKLNFPIKNSIFHLNSKPTVFIFSFISSKTKTRIPFFLKSINHRDMIIKKETRLQHPSPAKGSSLSFKKYQDLLYDSTPSPPPKTIGRSKPMIMQQSLLPRNHTREMMIATRRRRASKEMVRRALTPPARRLTWRWFDFRPTPSRLSVMSTAI